MNNYPSVVTRHKRIAAGGTIQLWATTIYLAQLVIIVGNAGTTWNIRMEDYDVTPSIIVPQIAVSAPSTLSWVYQYFKYPIPMINGLKVVTVSGTPGVMDIWFSHMQQSAQQ